ncbi:glutamyl-Q tRNA(Asp) synthetase [Nitrosomonas sp. Nm84]|uniref:tRNA glutamyl-Q(34) synthetase GluQRS n=1 Tax=Nitrosomonas sp. Nm84 TaxID=200124 RepID=UPI000D75A939|nr:tRNA glutamyl-Q(34) synthetase GluQRS [Nitrosomonas sp. Nm84]PXW85705.1 glutamyl-Q tRNA(Asp) synthetase [Nitrosomonas sp. Nm84]
MENSRHVSPRYRGRFAPSPTGSLHFGSLVAAVGSYLDARFNHGDWLVRIEDLDRQREMPGATSSILHTLETLGMEWDGDVMYQSQRSEVYRNAVDMLGKLGFIYPCICSRKEIADSSIMGVSGPVYPGTCLRNPAPINKAYALRVRTGNDVIEFNDRLRGLYSQRLRDDIGDFVLRRADSMYAYQLAVVVDDAEQQITHIVRGMDLLDSTPRQILLQRLLGYATPSYLHLPVVTNALGEKLSKQTHAAPIDVSNALMQLVNALHFLGQEPPLEMIEGDIASFWHWAQENWRVDQIPH